MNHSQLRAFHAVAVEGSFTRAARALRVSQPTLSGQVKALEEGYRVKLFERRGRGIQITEFGRQLLEVTHRQFNAEAEAQRLLAGARGLLRGTLRAGADSPYHLMPLLAAFGRRYPTISRAISFGNSQRVLRELNDFATDVAVLPEVGADERLHAVPFKRDRLVAFVQRGHPLARHKSIRMSALDGQPMVLREPGSTTRALFERAAGEAGITFGETLELGSREAVREAVAENLGIGIVNEGEMGPDERVQVLPVRGADLKVIEYVVCLRDRRDNPVVTAFLKLAAELADI